MTIRHAACAALLLTACTSPAPPDTPLADGMLDSNAAFIAVPRAPRSALAGATGDAEFYLAIRRDRLHDRFFFSAYIAQFYDGYPFTPFPATLGTRVVSFEVQNDKLFVLDASDGYKASAVFDNAILLEAYPVVRSASFERLRGADRYVLVDPAAGLNRFSVTGEIFADPDLASFESQPLRIGIAYLRNFRALADGVTFEEVISGDVSFDGPSSLETLKATFGISIREYRVGDGYTPIAAPQLPYFFLSDARLLPDSYGLTEANPVRWNLRPGQPPIRIEIGAGARRAQEAYPEIDLLGAFERGIEGWNEALGYQAFDAVLSDRDDLFGLDDHNVLIVDYPGVQVGYAFADYRHNPNNGEIRGASIFLDGLFIDLAAAVFPSTKPRSKTAPTRRQIVWGGAVPRRPPCVLRAPVDLSGLAERLDGDPRLTPAELAAGYVQHVVAHEMGHVLGLRHNLKGSLVPPSSSVMDYVDLFDTPLVSTPQAYDRQAVRYLYGLIDEPPTEPFCTDEDTASDASCAYNDLGAQPLTDHWAPTWLAVGQRFIDLGIVGAMDAYLNGLLGYARLPLDDGDAVRAALAALEPVAVPQIATAEVRRSRIDALAQIVLARLVLDPPELRGLITDDLTDPAALAAIDAQVARMITNEDGIRSYDLRRLGVDVLARQQSLEGYTTLLRLRDTLTASLPPRPADDPLLLDLVTRVERALTPYFD